MKNRYVPIKTNDEKVKILDTIIRFPLSTDLMTREARAIRESIPELAQGVLRSQNRAQVVCAVLSTGWVPLPDFPFADREHSGRMYRLAVIQLAEYLENSGELYDGLIVA